MTDAALDIVYEHLGVKRAGDMWLDEDRAPMIGIRHYVARSQTTVALVDHPLAVRLRANGVAWRGAIARDPCAVA